VKHTTRAGYGTVINLLTKDEFDSRKIDKVRLSDAKEWLIRLQQEDGKSYSAIHSIRGVLRPVFQMAVDDDILRKNPFEFMLATVLVNATVTREAITKKEERTFLDFIKKDKHYCKYYDGMYILFKTGMRISEFTGLTVKDIDMENKTINIDHQLQKTGTLVYIDSTKTYAGKRVIPMTDDVYECFKRILAKRKPPKVEPMIDGYSGFLWFDKDGKPMVAMHWEKYFQHAVEKYNRTYRIQLPKITPHVCRHTYCSNMAKSGMNPKVLQYLMGHSDISVTLNTYTHLKLDDAKEEMEKLARNQAKADEELRQMGKKSDGGKVRKMV
jgi:integrase